MSISATRSIPQKVFSKLIFMIRPEIKDGVQLATLLDDEIVTAGPVKKLSRDVAAVAAKIPNAPEEDGTYVLTCTVADGVATYSWEEQEE